MNGGCGVKVKYDSDVCAMLWMSHLLNEGDRLWGEKAREANVIVHNAVKHLLFIVTWKRRLAEKKNKTKFISSS